MAKGSYTAIFNRGEDILEIVIRDQSGNKIEVRRCNITDEDETFKIFKWLSQKYGVKFNKGSNWLSTESEFLNI